MGGPCAPGSSTFLQGPQPPTGGYLAIGVRLAVATGVDLWRIATGYTEDRLTTQPRTARPRTSVESYRS